MTLWLLFALTLSAGTAGAFAWISHLSLDRRADETIRCHRENMARIALESGIRMRAIWEAHGQLAPQKYYEAPYV